VNAEIMTLFFYLLCIRFRRESQEREAFFPYEKQKMFRPSFRSVLFFQPFLQVAGRYVSAAQSEGDGERQADRAKD